MFLKPSSKLISIISISIGVSSFVGRPAASFAFTSECRGFGCCRVVGWPSGCACPLLGGYWSHFWRRGLSVLSVSLSKRSCWGWNYRGPPCTSASRAAFFPARTLPAIEACMWFYWRLPAVWPWPTYRLHFYDIFHWSGQPTTPDSFFSFLHSSFSTVPATCRFSFSRPRAHSRSASLFRRPVRGRDWCTAWCYYSGCLGAFDSTR